MSRTEPDPPCVKLFRIQNQRENSSRLHFEGSNLPDLKEYLSIYAEQNSFCGKDRERLHSEHSPAARAYFQKGVREEFKALVFLSAQVTAPRSTHSRSCASRRKRLSYPSTWCRESIHLHEPDIEGATTTAPQHFLAVRNKLLIFTSKTLPSLF